MAIDPNKHIPNNNNEGRPLEQTGEFIFHVHQWERDTVSKRGPHYGNQLIRLQLVVVDGPEGSIGRVIYQSYQLEGDKVSYLAELMRHMGAPAIENEMDDVEVTNCLCWRPFIGLVRERGSYYNLSRHRALVPDARQALEKREYDFGRRGMPPNMMVRDRRDEQRESGSRYG